MNLKHSHLKINLYDWAQKVHSLWNKKKTTTKCYPERKTNARLHVNKGIF